MLNTSDVPCAFASDIETGTNNAMKKMWLQDWYPTSKNEESVLGALAYSPVAIGVYISDNIFAYSGGETSCKIICSCYIMQFLQR